MSLLLPLWALACITTRPGADTGPGGLAPGEAALTLTVADLVSTTITATWDANVGTVNRATLRVDPGVDDAFELDATGGEAVIWGLRAEQDVTVELTVVGSDATAQVTATATTGVVPNDLPALTVSGDAGGAAGGARILTTIVQDPGAAVIIDTEGHYRWWGDVTPQNLTSRARLSVDGQSILGMPLNSSSDYTMPLVRRAFDGTELETIEIDGMHHDFVEHSDGTLAVLVVSWGEVDGVRWLGDRIVERAPDGTETVIWDSWEDLTFHEGDIRMDNDEWTHANALLFDEAEQRYTVGLRGIHAIAAIDRATGRTEWLLGSSESDFTDPDGDRRILGVTHQFEFVDGGLLVFENRGNEDDWSRPVELAFDPGDPIVEPVWTVDLDPPVSSGVLGDVERLPDGDTLIDYSAAGLFVQVDADGTERWRLESELTGAFGYFSLLEGGDGG